MKNKKILVGVGIGVVVVSAAIAGVFVVGKDNTKRESDTVKVNESKVEIEKNDDNKVQTGSVDIEAITKEAEAKYEENKDKVSCDKKQFTDSYVALIQEGKTSEEAVSSCLATFMKKPDIQVEDPTTNNIDKDKYYLDENGVPQLKEEPSNNSTYTYREDIKSSQDAIIYLRSLGYTVSDVPTEAEVRAIYKEHSYIVSEQEFEDSLESCGVEFTLESIAYSILPSNGNVNTQNSDSVKNEFSGEKAVGEITYNSQSTWQPSNEPTQPSGPNIDVINPDVPDDIFDNLDPSLNDLFH